jgi:hypothetical protein
MPEGTAALSAAPCPGSSAIIACTLRNCGSCSNGEDVCCQKLHGGAVSHSEHGHKRAHHVLPFCINAMSVQLKHASILLLCLHVTITVWQAQLELQGETKQLDVLSGSMVACLVRKQQCQRSTKCPVRYSSSACTSGHRRQEPGWVNG